MTIKFDLDKAKYKKLLVDRNEILSEHSMEDKYKMTQDMPLVVCIEGSYIKANDLLEICEPHHKKLLSKWLLELKFPDNCNHKEIDFRWNR